MTKGRTTLTLTAVTGDGQSRGSCARFTPKNAALIVRRLRLLGVRYEDPALGGLLPDADGSQGLQRPTRRRKLKGVAERHVNAVWLHHHVGEGEISDVQPL